MYCRHRGIVLINNTLASSEVVCRTLEVVDRSLKCSSNLHFQYFLKVSINSQMNCEW